MVEPETLSGLALLGLLVIAAVESDELFDRSPSRSPVSREVVEVAIADRS
jgi:hypothetical protein